MTCVVPEKETNAVVDNFGIIGKCLDFSNFDYFYNIKIIVRNKDVGANSPYSKTFTSHKEHVISWYSIRSREAFYRCRDAIIALCDNNGFRAYIDLDTKSHSEASKLLLSKVQSDFIDAVKYKAGKDGKFQPLDVLVRSCMTKSEVNVSRDKSWVLLDLDDKAKYSSIYAYLCVAIEDLEFPKAICYETVAGYHVIVPLNEFNKWDFFCNKATNEQKIELQKKNGNIPEPWTVVMDLRSRSDIEVKYNANALLYCNMKTTKENK
ncbi:MAG: hypothetical protein K2M73_08020 [Lachnospiraceae bacterium]|nr:hypothetical protein [Lachnospiraceae bacterium]